MAASETISINSSASDPLAFSLYPLRFRFAANRPLRFAAGETANILRGQLGKALFQRTPSLYRPLFAPSTTAGPSGLRDLPRPFVLRVSHLDGARIVPGQSFEIGVNLFDMREPMIDAVREALCAAVQSRLLRTEGTCTMRLSLATPDTPVHRVRVSFLAPTELKGAEQPEFPVLFSRI